MHDPNTVAFSIKSPFRHRCGTTGSGFPRFYRPNLLTIWHRDAGRPGHAGSDDTCGWFMRASHGNAAVLERIVRAFEDDWDRIYSPERRDHDEDDGPFQKRLYMRGYFYPVDLGGMPVLSVHGIALNLFLLAAGWTFARVDHEDPEWPRPDWNRAHRFVQRHLAQILLFAENPTDSLYDSFVRTFSIGTNTPYTKRERDDRLKAIAATIYGWILRESRPWWKHPRWHVIHWRRSRRALAGWHFPVPFRGWYFQLHPWQQLRRWLFDRCADCGKRFAWGESPTTYNWHSPEPRWFRSVPGLYHSQCAGKHPCASAAAVQPPPSESC